MGCTSRTSETLQAQKMHPNKTQTPRIRKLALGTSIPWALGLESLPHSPLEILEPEVLMAHGPERHRAASSAPPPGSARSWRSRGFWDLQALSFGFGARGLFKGGGGWVGWGFLTTQIAVCFGV